MKRVKIASILSSVIGAIMLSTVLYVLYTAYVLGIIFQIKDIGSFISVDSFILMIGSVLLSLLLGIIGVRKTHSTRKFALWGIILSLFTVVLTIVGPSIIASLL